LRLQSYTEPVPLKYGKLHETTRWIYGYCLQCTYRKQSRVTDRPVFGEVDGGVIQRTGESADLADEVVMSLLVSWVIRIALRLHHLLFTHTQNTRTTCTYLSTSRKHKPSRYSGKCFAMTADKFRSIENAVLSSPERPFDPTGSDTLKIQIFGPILWGHSGPLCHVLSLLSSLSWTSMSRRCATVAACERHLVNGNVKLGRAAARSG